MTMSKRFRQQDHFRYKKLGTRWRKPRGRQSKLRKGKGGSGAAPNAGYGTERSRKNLVRGFRAVNVGDPARLRNLGVMHGVIVSSSVGMRKTLQIYRAAKEKNLTVLNMKKVKKALEKEEELRKRREERLPKAKETVKETGEKKET